MQRRNVILGLSLAAILAAPLAAGVAHAQDAYPNKPIRLIVPFPPGGTTDIVGRLFADKLSKELGQTVVVENRGGAGGSIGSAFVASSVPDGYVLGIATVSTHGINPAIYTNLPFDAEKDFTPISNLAAVPNIMVVNPKVPAKNIEDFIKLAKSQPGKLTYASAGNGSVSHMMGEMFKMASGTDLMHVPYRGVGPALNDTLAGQVDVLYDNLPVIDKLYAAVVKVSAEDDVKKRLEGLGAAPVANTPAEYAKQISEEIAKNKRIAKEANVKID